MAKADETGFPTFECIISHTMEDYDSEVEQFFFQRGYLAAELSKLRFSDPEWTENYEKMLQYLYDLAESIMNLTDPPSHQFLIDLSLGEEIEDDTVQRLMKARTPVVAEITMASLRVRDMIYWYVRNAKNEKFSAGFNSQRFQGLSFLRLALVYRSVSISNRQ